MTTPRGKLITMGLQQRFFPALSSPQGALDEAPDRERDDKDDDRDDREAALDAREAALDMREADEDDDKDDEEAKDRHRARDARAIARDKRAHARRAAARDGELGEAGSPPVATRARGGRDAPADPQDHRRDFRSGDRARDGKSRATADSRRGMDARMPTLAEIFPSMNRHPNASADADVDSIFGSH